MTSRQVVRFLSSLSTVAMMGFLATGCVIQDPPALKQIHSAGDAVAAAKKKAHTNAIRKSLRS